MQSTNPPLAQQTLTIQQALDLAVQHYNAGDLPKAENVYQQILQAEPNEPIALHMLGVIAHQVGKYDIAVDLMGKALVVKPDYVDAHNNLGLTFQNLGQLELAANSYKKAVAINTNFAAGHYNLGNVLKELGRSDEAVESYKKAININPNYSEAYGNLGLVLNALGQQHEAIDCYQKAIEITPNYAKAHYNLGAALYELGHLDEAISHYRKSIEIKPDFAEAFNNMGQVLHDLGRKEDAIGHYHHAIEIMPEYADALNNLAVLYFGLGRIEEAGTYCYTILKTKPDYAGAHHTLGLIKNAQGQISEAIDCFQHCFELKRGATPINSDDKSFTCISKTKINHDIEQFQYIDTVIPKIEMENPTQFSDLADLYKTLRSEIVWPEEDSAVVTLTNEQRQLIGNSYNRSLYAVKTPELGTSPINGLLNVQEITDNFSQCGSGITYFDNFLTHEALLSLRRFMLNSTIWYDFFHKGGYLGGYLGDGLDCPLLLQIAEHLRRAFPKIFKDHILKQLWAYKYDSSLTGIDVHGDEAAVNVNFWITPNTANLDPASGGLIVHDVEAPMDWNFNAFNNDQKRIRNFLYENDSKKTIIPHRENRAVLFNSNLFHETDNIVFKPGYKNRRINITMLFGNR